MERVRAILRDDRVRTDGEPSLEWLHAKDDAEVKRVLTSFKGVGPKTVACVMMFTMGRAEFPVDTHVLHIAKKLGWLPQDASREQAYEHLNRRVPNECKLDLHVLPVEHGCAPSAPRTASSRRPSPPPTVPARRPILDAHVSTRTLLPTSGVTPPPHAKPCSSPTSTSNQAHASFFSPCPGGAHHLLRVRAEGEARPSIVVAVLPPVGVLVVLAFLALLLLGRGGRLGLPQFGLLSQNLDSLVCFSSVTSPLASTSILVLVRCKCVPRRLVATNPTSRRPPRDTKESQDGDAGSTPSLRNAEDGRKVHQSRRHKHAFPPIIPEQRAVLGRQGCQQTVGVVSSFATLISKIWPPTFSRSRLRRRVEVIAGKPVVLVAVFQFGCISNNRFFIPCALALRAGTPAGLKPAPLALTPARAPRARCAPTPNGSRVPVRVLLDLASWRRAAARRRP